MRFYLTRMKNAGLATLVEQHETEILPTFYSIPLKESEITSLLSSYRYIIFIKVLKEILDIFKHFTNRPYELFEYLSSFVFILEAPPYNLTREQFAHNIHALKEEFNKIETEFKPKLLKLDNEQISRMDEALTTYFEDCPLSSIILFVSVIEWELYKLLNKDKELASFYREKHPKLKNPTFGVLIGFFNKYLDNEQLAKYSWLKKFKVLFDLCNDYRKFSAHEKGIKVSTRVASAILSLTFEFLFNKPES